MIESEKETKPQLNKRRSQRLLLSMRVAVRGLGQDNQPFEEETHTLVVNAHGGLLALGASVMQGQRLVLVNVQTKEEQECKVLRIGQNHGGKKQVAFEFMRPAPRFWRVSFPPDDWKELPD